MLFRLQHLLAVIAICAVAFLLIRAAVRSDRQSRYLHAAQDGDLDTIRSCLARGVDVNTRDGWSSTALMYASASGHDDIIGELLDAGANPNERTRLKRTPLMWAAKYGHASTIKLLLERGADSDLRDAEQMTAFDHAQANGHTRTAALLDATTENRQNNVVHPSTRVGRFEVVSQPRVPGDH